MIKTLGLGKYGIYNNTLKAIGGVNSFAFHHGYNAYGDTSYFSKRRNNLCVSNAGGGLVFLDYEIEKWKTKKLLDVDYEGYYGSEIAPFKVGDQTADLVNYKLAFRNLDSNSVWINPNLTNAIAQTPRNALLNRLGEANQFARFDIDSTRSQYGKRIGCNNVLVTNPDIALAKLFYSRPTANSVSCHLIATNVGQAPATSYNIEYTFRGNRRFVSSSNSLAAGESDTLLLAIEQLSEVSTANIQAYVTATSPADNATTINDTARLVIDPQRLCGNYTIGKPTSDFPLLYDALLMLEKVPVTCPVQMLLEKGSHIGPLTFNKISGLDSLNTLTFAPLDGDSADTEILGGINRCLREKTFTSYGYEYYLPVPSLRFYNLGLKENSITAYLDRSRFVGCSFTGYNHISTSQNNVIERSVINGSLLIQRNDKVYDQSHGYRFDRLFQNNRVIGKLRLVSSIGKIRGNNFTQDLTGSTVLELNGYDVGGNLNIYNNLFKTSSQGAARLDSSLVVIKLESSYGPGCRFHHNTFEGNDSLGQLQGGAVLVANTVVAVDSNKFINAAKCGISFRGNARGSIAFNRIQGFGGIDCDLGYYYSYDAVELLSIFNNKIHSKEIGIRMNGNYSSQYSPVRVNLVRIARNTVHSSVGSPMLFNSKLVDGKELYSYSYHDEERLVCNNSISGAKGLSLGCTFVYNTVKINGSADTSSFGSMIYPNTRNNIITYAGGGQTLKGHAGYPVFYGTGSDYNAYFNASPYFAAIGGSYYSTFVNYRSAQNVDANSIFVDPKLSGDSILRPAEPLLNGSAIPIAGIITDIDGELRNGSAPDPGADEYSFDFGLTRLLSPTGICALSDSELVTVNVTQYGDAPFKDIVIACKVNTDAIIYDTVRGTSTNDILHTFRQRLDLSGRGGYNFKLWLVSMQDENPFNDTIRIRRVNSDAPSVSFLHLVGCVQTPVQFTGTARASGSATISRYQYSFGDGDTIGSLSGLHRFDTSQSYTVSLKAYTTDGCYGEFSSQVRPLQTPIAAIGQVLACASDSFMLPNATWQPAPSQSLSYTWAVGASFVGAGYSPKIAHPDSAILPARLIATGTNGCSDTSSGIIIVRPRPSVVVFANGPLLITRGSSVSLLAHTASPVLRWNTGSLLPSIVVQDSGLFYATATNTSGCSAKSQILRISIRPVPIIDLGPDKTFCMPSEPKLTVPAGFAKYRWSTGDSGISITPTRSGSFSLVVEDSLGQTASDIIYITLKNIVRAKIDTFPTQRLCAFSQEIRLTGDQAGGLFSGMAVSSSGIIAAKDLLPGTYSIRYSVVNSSLCVLPDTVSFSVNPRPARPILTIGGGQTITFCIGDSILIGFVGNGAPKWNNDATTSRLVARETGAYFVQLQSDSGCLSLLSDTLDVRAIGRRPRGGLRFALDTLYATDTAANTLFKWYFNNQIVSVLKNFRPSVSGRYTLVSSDRLNNGCQIADTITIIVTSIMATSYTKPEIYPNPSSDLVWLKPGFSNPALLVEIIDAIGKTVMYKTLVVRNTDQNFCFEIQNLPKGQYRLKFLGNSGQGWELIAFTKQ